ncbi:MAG: GNAT family N-acetyltransferase [Lachnospiraceae bacterium]|nr:GNAT family N-acetyltransferase [Lachnospiraceae bacterium]
METNTGIRIISGRQVKKKHLLEAIKLDELVYKEIYRVDPEVGFGFVNINPEIYIMAVDASDSVIGYINFSPITKKMYEGIRSGDVIDSSITPDDIEPYENGRSYQFYFSSICVHPDYRGRGVAGALLAELKQFIKGLSERNIRIKRIVADAVSDSGRNILLKNGFVRIKDSTHESTIMEKVYE